MILSNKRIIKALIRLCMCTGWSVPLLLANSEDRLSHVEPFRHGNYARFDIQK